MFDFTLDIYEELLQELLTSNNKIYTVRDWIQYSPNKGLCLRHDVDRKPYNSIRIAELENK